MMMIVVDDVGCMQHFLYPESRGEFNIVDFRYKDTVGTRQWHPYNRYILIVNSGLGFLS